MTVHRRMTWMFLASSAFRCPVLTANVLSWLTSALVSPLPDAVTSRLSVISTANGDSTHTDRHEIRAVTPRMRRLVNCSRGSRRNLSSSSSSSSFTWSPDRMLAIPWRRLFLAAYTLWAKPGCCCCPAWQTVICCIISSVRLLACLNKLKIIIVIIIILPKELHSQRTWKLAKCSDCVRNGYHGDSEIVSELARHTALKRWIATEILWYRNAASRVSAVQRVALLPISVRKCWASSARGPSVLIATGQKICYYYYHHSFVQ